MNSDNAGKEKNNKLDAEAAQLLMDGLLTEFGRNAGENDHDFVAQVVEAAARSGKSRVRRTSVIFINSMAIAAALVIVCSVIYYFSSVSSGKDEEIKPCVLARSCSGLVISGGEKKVIANGIRLQTADELKISSKASAFVLFPELSKIEIGTGSVVKFNRIPRRVMNSAKPAGYNREIVLKTGVIEADIVRQNNGVTLTVRTEAGDFMTGNGRFVLIKSPELCYVEVKQGAVKLRKRDGSSVKNITAGQRFMIANGRVVAAREPAAGIDEYKSKLTMHDSGFVDLLLELNKKAKADVCLRNKLEIINQNFNDPERRKRLEL